MKTALYSLVRNKVLWAKILAMLAVTLTIYSNDLVAIGSEAVRSEEMSYVIAVPFMVIYLLYRKRAMLKALASSDVLASHQKRASVNEISGILLCVFAITMYLYGSYTFYPLECHVFSLPIFLAGLILGLFNAQTLRALAFPLVLLLFLTPPPLEVLHWAGMLLSTVGSEAVYVLLKAVGLSVILGTQYGTPVLVIEKAGSVPLTFAVDLACGGIRSLIGFALPAIFVASVARTTLRRKAAVFLIGFPLIWTLNVFRMFTVVLIGSNYGMEMATHAFHLFGSWFIIFAGTLVLLVLSEKIFKIQLFISREGKSGLATCNYCGQENEKMGCPACGKILKIEGSRLSRRDLSKIAVLLMTATLVLPVKISTFSLAEVDTQIDIPSVSNEETITRMLPEINGYAIKFVYRDRAFERIAKQDASLTYAYLPSDDSEATIWLTMEIAEAISSLHRWEVCLITWALAYGYQPRVVQLSLKDVQVQSNPPTVARYFAFKDSESSTSQVVLYWYETAIFETESDFEKMHVKMSLIFFTDDLDDIPYAETKLLMFGRNILDHWRPTKPWPQIVVLICKHGNILLMLLVALLATAIVYETTSRQRERDGNLEIYNKLSSEEEKAMLRAVHHAAKDGKSTGVEVASTYGKLTGKPIRFSAIAAKLAEAYDIGLITKDIVAEEDEPLMVWKSQISFS